MFKKKKLKDNIRTFSFIFEITDRRKTFCEIYRQMMDYLLPFYKACFIWLDRLSSFHQPKGTIYNLNTKFSFEVLLNSNMPQGGYAFCKSKVGCISPENGCTWPDTVFPPLIRLQPGEVSLDMTFVFSF